MMKKRPPSFPIHPGSRLFISLTTVLFIFALFRLHSLSKLPSSAPARNAAAAVLSRPSNPFVGTPKIAFLFLARSNLPLDFLWQGFFQNAEEGSFSVYIHSKPGFVFDRSTTRCAFFYGRQLSKSFQRDVIQTEQDCIPDEHYMQTLLAILYQMSELEDGLERRSLTFALWNQSASETEKQSWHTVTFKHDDASPERIKEIKGINHVYYETEYRTEWCRSNATSMLCFLFARKFSRGAAMRLLREGVVGSFDASVLLA